MIDYGALPPEVNSGRMYAGAGSGPMLAAAAAWDVLADELGMTSAALEMTIVDLYSGPWRGPAAMSMAAAGLPFAAWFKATAAQAEQAATQAKAAAAAYQTAFAMHVHPVHVGANRAQLMLLIATNFFGQNTPAIAATEAEYAAMWAQDAAAMYGYVGSSSAALKLSEFGEPPRATNPPQSSTPPLATNPAAHSVGTTPATSTMPAPLPTHPASPTAIAPNVMAQLSSFSTSPAVPGTTGSATSGLKAFLDQWTGLNRLAGSGFSPTPLGDGVSQALITWEHSPNAYMGVRDVLADTAKAAEGAAKSVGTSAITPGAGGGLPTAALGRGIQIGGLSVPQAWPSGSGVPNPAAATLVSSRVAAVAAAEAEGLPRAGFGMPGMPGAATAGGATGFRFVPRYGYRHKVMNRPPGAG